MIFYANNVAFLAKIIYNEVSMRGEESMNSKIKTQSFEIEYAESVIANDVLRENHCHGQFEVIGVIAGDITVILEGKQYRLAANQCAIIPPLVYHTVAANRNGEYRRITVLFDAAAFPEALRARFMPHNGNPTIFNFIKLEELKKICESGDDGFYAPLADSLMVQMLYESITGGILGNAPYVDESLSRILNYIESNICKKISLNDVAANVALSKSALCHLFAEKMQISPKQYILRKKLALADKLIRDGAQPTLVAIQLGYENYSDFYRIYRKHLGRTPRIASLRGREES